jgi:serum/glucocorticoid-regulated kinase 2
VKVIDISRKDFHERAKNEIKILSKIESDFIIKYYYHFEDDFYFYIFLEYANGGDLFHYIRRYGRLEEEKAFGYFEQILSALDYCHVKKMVHHDVKLENILIVKDGSIRLSDFGFAVEMLYSGGGNNGNHGLINSCSGSPLYMCPELFSNQPHNEKVDVWGLGVCLYFMLTDMYPFFGNNYNELEEKVIFCNVGFPGKMNLSEDVKDLIKKMLKKDYNQRISMEELKGHNWFIDGMNKKDKWIRKPFKINN